MRPAFSIWDGTSQRPKRERNRIPFELEEDPDAETAGLAVGLSYLVLDPGQCSSFIGLEQPFNFPRLLDLKGGFRGF